MAGIYTREYNLFIDNASEIYDYLTGNYMESYANRVLDCGCSFFNIAGMQFIRILQYRRTKSESDDRQKINEAFKTCLRACHNRNASFGFFVVSHNGNCSIYLGAESYSAEEMKRTFSSYIGDVQFDKGFISLQELERVSKYGGVVTADIECENTMIDSIIAAISSKDGIVGILASPMTDEELTSYVDGLSMMKQSTHFLLNNDITYSSQNRRTNRRNYSHVPEIDALLEDKINFFTDYGEDYWKTCIWFGCEEKDQAEALGTNVAAALNACNENELGKARCFATKTNPFKRGELAIPKAEYGDFSYVPDNVRKPSLCSYVSTSHLASIMQLPLLSVKGFRVIQLEKDENSNRLFEEFINVPEEKSISLGRVTGSNEEYSIELNDLTEHVLVTGATGSGKTNTVMNLIMQTHKAGIPVLIIEPSKKDYWRLAMDIRDMNIYSFGKDAPLLYINPLAPEDGVIIANHIDSLLYAFQGAFDMEEPTRLALDGLLKYAYQQFGWELFDIANKSGRDYPKIDDLIRLLPEFFKSNIPYGDEVKSNIYGSLVNRLSSLNTGMTGIAFNGQSSISGKELCSKSILVELDDLSLDTKPFISMLLMIKVDQYLRQTDSSNVLKNVVVLEEAHNILGNISVKNGQPSKDRASRYFSNMLSQVRGYGTGIIIADQGASQINDMAISNTKIKIIHSVVDASDIDKIAFALNLSETQKRVFPSLPTGEAVAAVRGKDSVSRIRVNITDKTSINNIACAFCKSKAACSRYNNIISDIPRASLYAGHIYNNRFNGEETAGIIDSIAQITGWQHEKRCLLGEVIETGHLDCGDREKRRIVQNYAEYIDSAK